MISTNMKIEIFWKIMYIDMYYQDGCILLQIGTSLLQTAAHEFGHSLGLSHTDSKEALMAPFYRGFEQSPKLEKDDIRAIQVKSYNTYTFLLFNQKVCEQFSFYFHVIFRHYMAKRHQTLTIM